jgi:Methyltransferase domain
MNPVKQRLKRFLHQTRAGRILLIPLRFRTALSFYTPQLKRILGWTVSSREAANFTYDITAQNCEYLAHVVSAVTGVPYSKAMGYLREILGDEDIKRHVITQIGRSPMRNSCDKGCKFGRRIGWYAFVRITKPRVVVETGVDKGHGAVVLCAALIRNEAEGFPGRYFGTDINPDAGFLLTEPYNRVGQILYGDSILSLQSIPEIDVLINDSDHSVEYERREYETIAPKLGARGGLILSDNSHYTDVLAKFSVERGRRFIFFQEQPERHWYPGAGIGISYPKGMQMQLDGGRSE